MNGQVAIDTIKSFALEMGLPMKTIDVYFTNEFVSFLTLACKVMIN